MSIKLTPYLNFNGNTKEAMEFYKSIFGGELKMQTFGETMTTGDAEMDKGIMHSELESGGVHFMASEGAPGTSIQHGNNMSMSLFGGPEDADVLKGYFAKLSEGGSIAMPLDLAPWGDYFGIVLDQFGIQWYMNISSK